MMVLIGNVNLSLSLVVAANRQPKPGSGDLIHIATANPISLYTMDPRKQHLSCLDLYDIFPSHRGSYSRPRLHVAPLGFPLDANVLIYEGIVSPHVASGFLRSYTCSFQCKITTILWNVIHMLMFCILFQSNILLDIDYETSQVRRIERTSTLEAAAEHLSKSFRKQQGIHKMCADFCHEGDGMVLLYKEDGYKIMIIIGILGNVCFCKNSR